MIAALIAAIVLVTAACKKKNKPEAADAETESVGAVPEVIENDSGIPGAETEDMDANAVDANDGTEDVNDNPASTDAPKTSADKTAQPSGPIKSSNYEDGYVEGEDYNPTNMSWLAPPTLIAQSEDGCYFIGGCYVFFTDAETLTSVPLCYQLNCLHNEETDPYKVSECQAFTGLLGATDNFIGIYEDELIYICTDFSTLKREMVRMKKDGSSKKTILSDIYNVDPSKAEDAITGASYFRMHRGVIYYFSTGTDLDGNKTISMKALSLADSGEKPRELFSIPGKGSQPHALLPCGNYVYYEIDTEEKGSYSFSIYAADIRTGEVTEVFDKDAHYSLYGARNGKIILAGDGYFEYSRDTGLQEDQGIKHFKETHPELQVCIECIDKDLMILSGYNTEKGDFEKNLYVTDLTGETLCEIEGEALGTLGGQMVRLGDDEYYVRFSKSLEPFAVKAYKKTDLLSGSPEYTILFEVEDFNENLNPGYIVPTPEE